MCQRGALHGARPSGVRPRRKHPSPSGVIRLNIRVPRPSLLTCVTWRPQERSAPPAKSSSVAAARGKSKPKRRSRRPLGECEVDRRRAGDLPLYPHVLRRGVSDSVGEHDPHAARRRLAVRQQARVRPAHSVHEVNLPGYTDPKRGDVVVFVSPLQPDEAASGNDPTPTLVKRLVGMPGDTLYMRDGLLYVNGIAQRQGFAAANNREGRSRRPIEPAVRLADIARARELALRSARPRSRRTTTGARSSFRPGTTS